MNKYKVHGEYTISFDVEVVAESEEEAISIAEDINITETCNNCIMADPIEDKEVTLNADGMIENVTADYIGKEEDYADNEGF